MVSNRLENYTNSLKFYCSIKRGSVIRVIDRGHCGVIEDVDLTLKRVSIRWYSSNLISSYTFNLHSFLIWELLDEN